MWLAVSLTLLVMLCVARSKSGRVCVWGCTRIIRDSLDGLVADKFSQLALVHSAPSFIFFPPPDACIIIGEHTNTQASRSFQLEFEHHADNATLCWLFSPLLLNTDSSANNESMPAKSSQGVLVFRRDKKFGFYSHQKLLVTI